MNLYDMLLFRKLSGGGGGDSDFTTVEVTIQTDSMFASSVMAMIPFLVSADNVEALMPVQMVTEPGEEHVLSVVLYKGKAFALLWDTGHNLPYGTVSVSGDITEEDGSYIITGPGTIILYGGK